jgi:hypothetical protein
MNECCTHKLFIGLCINKSDAIFVISIFQSCGMNITRLVGFEVLTAMSTKMVVFWVVAPCSLVEVYQRFRGPCSLHHQGDHRPDDEAARTSETLVNFYQTTRRYNPEDSHLLNKTNLTFLNSVELPKAYFYCLESRHVSVTLTVTHTRNNIAVCTSVYKICMQCVR